MSFSVETPHLLRPAWIRRLQALAAPPLAALSAGRLLATLPLPAITPSPSLPSRHEVAALEILARVLVGIAPWLELADPPEEEKDAQTRLRGLAQSALARSLDPASPDTLNFSCGSQPLVDAAFLGLACLSAPQSLFHGLDPSSRDRLVEGWRATRSIPPYENNWWLFASVIEAAIHHFAGELRPARVVAAVAKHAAWYRGDGAYGDGPDFHWDYYNSFVIHPLLLETLEQLEPILPGLPIDAVTALRRARRYAEVQERMIAPDGSFPPLGRSIAYRCGAFHLLARLALRHQLPDTLAPGAVRDALEAVMRRTLDAPGSFDSAGWLTVGLAGSQPALGEPYICAASCYLATTALLPLGLPATDPFWSAPPSPWTAARLWNGENLPPDTALPSTLPPVPIATPRSCLN